MSACLMVAEFLKVFGRSAPLAPPAACSQLLGGSDPWATLSAGSLAALVEGEGGPPPTVAVLLCALLGLAAGLGEGDQPAPDLLNWPAFARRLVEKDVWDKERRMLRERVDEGYLAEEVGRVHRTVRIR